MFKLNLLQILVQGLMLLILYKMFINITCYIYFFTQCYKKNYSKVIHVHCISNFKYMLEHILWFWHCLKVTETLSQLSGRTSCFILYKYNSVWLTLILDNGQYFPFKYLLETPIFTLYSDNICISIGKIIKCL